jgi:uncharacterized protein VcgC/VcgE DUF2780
MNRRDLLIGSAALITLSGAYAPPSGAALDPFKGLGKSLGMSKDQVKGGLGSVLTLAQEKLAKGDFDKLAGVIPGASKYLDQAKKLGAVTGPLNNLAGLTGALGKLGIDQQTVSKFLPAVTDLVSKVGGPEIGNLLKGVLST